MGRGFDIVVAELSKLDGNDDDDVATPLLEIIPVTGVSIATLGDFLGSETVAASDAQAARIDEIQFDLNEGPCWDALTELGPVIEPDVRATPLRNWPAFSEAIQNENVGALFAFPLSIGSLRVGAVDLYNATPCTLSAESLQRAAELMPVMSRYVLRRALRLSADAAVQADPHSRRLIHQATGFVIAQLGVSAEDAHLLLQGQAFAEGRRMSELARDVIEHRFRFVAGHDGISSTS